MLSELAVYLPDYQPEESFEDAGREDGEGTGEPGFGGRVAVSLKPVRRLAAPRLPEDIGSEFEGDGDAEPGDEGGGGTGRDGGEGGNRGKGEGDGRGGTGTRGGSSSRHAIPVSAVRLLPVIGIENCYRLSFLPEEDGIARLSLDEAGDSSSLRRDDIRAESAAVSLERIPVKKGRRTTVDITGDEPIDGRAWRLSAAAAVEEDET